MLTVSRSMFLVIPHASLRTILFVYISENLLFQFLAQILMIVGYSSKIKKFKKIKKQKTSRMKHKKRKSKHENRKKKKSR
jgi:predicted membrane protein